MAGIADDVFWALIKKANTLLSVYDNVYDMVKQHTAYESSKFRNLDPERAVTFLRQLSETRETCSDTSLDELQSAIEKLRIRAYELMIEALKEKRQDGKNYKTAQAAFELYVKLNKFTQTYANSSEPNKDKEKLFTDITTAIEAAEPHVQDEPGIKEIIYNILNVLLKWFESAVQLIKPKYKIGLLDARTESEIVVGEVKGKIPGSSGG